MDGVETRFVRAGGLCLQERNSSNSVTRSYVWDSVAPGGIGGLLEMTEGSAHYNYLYDGKGNVRALIDGSQDVVASYAYDEFGNLAGSSGTLDQPYRFSTKRYYAGFGTSDYGYRFYSASLGRWMSRDPLGEAGGLNLYGFVGNGPMNAIDAWGLLFNPFTDIGIWLADAREWHYSRNDYNQTYSSLEMAKKAVFTKMVPDYKNEFHRLGDECNNRNAKYTSKDGHSELVFDAAGNLVTDPLNIGTYNFVPEGESWAGHFAYDVLPYLIWGNAYNDPSTSMRRTGAFIDGIQKWQDYSLWGIE